MRQEEIRVRKFFKGADRLSTRENGLRLREKVNEVLREGEDVILDFEGIELVTQSFIDEVIGVIVREKGLEFLKRRIKIKNANSFVKETVKFVIAYSVKKAA